MSRDQQSMSRNPLCKSKRKKLSRQRLSKGKHLAAGKASMTGMVQDLGTVAGRRS